MNLSALMSEYLMLTTVVVIACAPAVLQKLRSRAGRNHGA